MVKKGRGGQEEGGEREEQGGRTSNRRITDRLVTKGAINCRMTAAFVRLVKRDPERSFFGLPSARICWIKRKMGRGGGEVSGRGSAVEKSSRSFLL